MRALSAHREQARYAVVVRVTLVLFVAACWTSASTRDQPAKPIASAPATAAAATCEQSTHGIARAIGGAPNDYVRALCARDRWSDDARACFARLAALDGLVPCADRLDRDALVQFFREIEDPHNEPLTVAIAISRLGRVHTGIAECDGLVAAVSRAFACEAIPLADRMLLEELTNDFRDATNPRLRATFATLCTKSIGEVAQQTAVAGCRP